MLTALITMLAAAAINVIPRPAEMKVSDGAFDLSAPGAADRIEFTLDRSSGIPAEGYTLSVTPDRIKAVASTEAGLFYAYQTLLQLSGEAGEAAASGNRATLGNVRGGTASEAQRWGPKDVAGGWLPESTAGGLIQCVEIKDWPRFGWRGFHLDPCRHFLSIEDTKRMIDILSQYKINVLHWHLTDDQGWRIEIKKYPELTRVGAWRTEFDGSVHGGYYTQDQIREVVAYAAERHMRVIPEIEMPGHAIAAIRAYPRLSCTGEEVKTFYTWGTPNISLCIGKESTFEFLEDVITEVCELFPDTYIHIGGDECRKDRWEKCPLCQARIEAEGLVSDEKGTAVEKLQSYAVHRMEGILERHGRRLIGWDEILEGGLSPNATVMSWRGESGGIKAAKEGHDIIMTPGSEGMYFDAFQGESKVEPPTIGNYTTLEKVYNYDPVPSALKESGKDYLVKGVQCNNWSEYMYEDWQRYYMLFPRAFALAEIAWSSPEGKDFADFCRRSDAACRRLDAIGVTYHIPIPEQPVASCDNLAFSHFTFLEFKTSRPMEMVFTTDGSEPTAASERYSGPIRINRDTDVKIASLTSYGKLGPVRTVKARRMQPLPASEPRPLRVYRTDGKFHSGADLEDARWYGVDVKRLRDITSLEPYDRNLPDSTRFFAARAKGSFSVPEDGTYRFSSDCDEVWIDGIKLIDNTSAKVKRHSGRDAELVLEKGAHNFEMLYIFNIVGGWNPLRNKTEIYMLPEGASEWKPIKISQ